MPKTKLFYQVKTKLRILWQNLEQTIDIRSMRIWLSFAITANALIRFESACKLRPPGAQLRSYGPRLQVASFFSTGFDGVE